MTVPSSPATVPPTEDPAYPRTGRAAATVGELDALVVDCRACPRLVAWREEVAVVKRASFRDETYWARPAPGFGDPGARILVVGLAPAAHGANRTGRMFTGDRSGDFLFAALHRTGFASQPTSTHLGDGLTLTGLRLTAPGAVRAPGQPAHARGAATVRAVAGTRARARGAGRRRRARRVRLGCAARHPGGAGLAVPRPRPRFAHGAQVALDGPDGRTLTLLGCFHVSQQNTFTGRLTPAMLDAVLVRARELAGL